MSASIKSMEANLWDHLAFLAKGCKDATVRDTPDLLLVDSGLKSDVFNKIGRCMLNPRFAADRIQAAVDHFRKKTEPAPFTWLTGPLSGQGALDATLRELGLTPKQQSWGMLLQLDTAQLPPSPTTDLEIKRATSKAGVKDFATVVAELWTPPDENVVKFYESAADAVLATGAQMKLYVGYKGGKPVATTEAFYAHGVVGLSNIITTSAEQGKGYGIVLMIAALKDAKKFNQRMAAVQADEKSKALYQRVGFKPAGQFAEYRWAAN
ncbi:MAG: GNAT family N-acetyltransferase [Rhodospirillaceae bacterium]|nr:GNAT family N-acetyltransferase [Rhodospirillaceae bacterium]